MSKLGIFLYLVSISLFCFSAHGNNKTFIPLATSMYENLPSRYIIEGSPAAFVPTRSSGHFGSFLNQFSSEISRKLIWCGYHAAQLSQPPCFYDFSFSTHHLDKQRRLLVASLQEGYTREGIQPVGIYAFFNMTSVGFAVLDEISIYDFKDPYYSDIVSLPQSSHGIEEKSLNLQGRLVFHEFSANKMKERYGLYYPEIKSSHHNQSGHPRAFIIFQGFYPEIMADQIEAAYLPVLNKNLRAYTHAL